MLASALTVVALVAADQTALQAAPRDSAPSRPSCGRGDSLEIRGEKGDFLQVYDHRREQAGYIRASQVRVQSLKPEAAPELLAVVRFLKETPGSEALGIAYAAAYLRAAPAEAIGAEVFDALGQMADRLARRASTRPGRTRRRGQCGPSGSGGRLRRDHDGLRARRPDPALRRRRAQRRVLALPASAVQKALAALALTRHECISPALTPVERYALDNWRADVLERVELGALPEVLRTYPPAPGQGGPAWPTSGRAGRKSAPRRCRKPPPRPSTHSPPSTRRNSWKPARPPRRRAAIQVGASRWAAAPGVCRSGKLSVVASAGEPGQTCIALVEARQERGRPSSPAAPTASYGPPRPRPRGRQRLSLRCEQRHTARWGGGGGAPRGRRRDPGLRGICGWVPGGRSAGSTGEVKVAGRY
ncbi:MAG: hypothetical protein IPJ99_01235, partial [Betaproteobacteria bacterium]|nr:hypothetical protein [Betaproteobacteria bacterium]